MVYESEDKKRQTKLGNYLDKANTDQGKYEINENFIQEISENY
jgi:hypothetical protein